MAPISAASDGAPYADALRREIMRSEQQRMRAVAIILVFLLLVTVAATGLLPELSERLMDGGVPMWMPVSTMGPFIVYEIVALLVLRWRMAHDRDFPMIGRFVNALVETSLPGAIVYVMGSRMAAHVALGGWPPLLFFIFILLSTLRLDFWLSVWTGIVAAVELLLLANWLLPLSWDGPVNETFHYHSSRSLILLLGGVVAGLVAVSLRRQFENSVATAAARDRVTNLFGQHVSPAVVDRLLETGAELPSEVRRVCVLFLDIRGFTAETRTRTAPDTVALLNDFFAEMVDIVDRHNGIVNKFLGDGFLALFGAPFDDPNAAEDAVAAGQAMLVAIDRWNVARPSQVLRVGIGIHEGEAVTGTIGSPQRKEYTVIGDTVNLAARLEQLTKETGARLLVSGVLEPIARARAGQDLGPIAIRGYEDKVRVWRLA
ncbi:MAG: adenylate/guanylate cyclase domain-containing protein [Proteobacteria bacterium]|nr:adenylate/guanylate cyclase domain-containing protein [Pseudomonadota bacterium]